MLQEWILLSGRLAFVGIVFVGILCGVYWRRLSGIKRLLLAQVILLLLGWAIVVQIITSPFPHLFPRSGAGTRVPQKLKRTPYGISLIARPPMPCCGIGHGSGSGPAGEPPGKAGPGDWGGVAVGPSGAGVGPTGGGESGPTVPIVCIPRRRFSARPSNWSVGTTRRGVS